ncbi:unnamed protein product [Amoebophrya sp. A25]|nr:unnamed protein product [Amoebophrya sp. A25]|eukprot:GSA25T00013765001.1
MLMLPRPSMTLRLLLSLAPWRVWSLHPVDREVSTLRKASSKKKSIAHQRDHRRPGHAHFRQNAHTVRQKKHDHAYDQHQESGIIEDAADRDHPGKDEQIEDEDKHEIEELINHVSKNREEDNEDDEDNIEKDNVRGPARSTERKTKLQSFVKEDVDDDERSTHEEEVPTSRHHDEKHKLVKKKKSRKPDPLHIHQLLQQDDHSHPHLHRSHHQQEHQSHSHPHNQASHQHRNQLDENEDDDEGPTMADADHSKRGLQHLLHDDDEDQSFNEMEAHQHHHTTREGKKAHHNSDRDAGRHVHEHSSDHEQTKNKKLHVAASSSSAHDRRALKQSKSGKKAKTKKGKRKHNLLLQVLKEKQARKVSAHTSSAVEAPGDTVGRFSVYFWEKPYRECQADNLDSVKLPFSEKGYMMFHKCANICQTNPKCGGFLIKNIYGLMTDSTGADLGKSEFIEEQQCIPKKNFYLGRPLWASCVPADDTTTYIRKTVWQFSKNSLETKETEDEMPLSLGGTFPDLYHSN